MALQHYPDRIGLFTVGYVASGRSSGDNRNELDLLFLRRFRAEEEKSA
jgi:hypothetical protein